ncbi:MAG: NAD(P)-dependent oxidoreductase, partial [Gammaproteobacteria bacterium]|nr:NAD(P)-dependent oxidoreductase [Gammaproteobacteria bacterium]
MRPRKVLVTGACGRVGRFVVSELAPLCDVTVLDLVKPDVDVPYLEGDVIDLATVRRAMAGQDAVVHLAAIDLGVPAEPERYFGVNVMGTWNVLQAACEAGAGKAVLASSISANGTGEMRADFPPEYLPVDEAHPSKPVHPYGVSKLVVEDVAQSFARRGDISVVCLRPTAVAVPSHLPRLIERARNRDHRWLAAYVTGPDTASAFRLALDYERERYDVFFVTAADSCSDEPTLERAERLFGHLPEIRDRALFQREPRASMIDARRARDRLGWEPTSS